MDIYENFENEVNVLSLSGRLDANSALKLNEVIEDSLKNNKLNIVINCENLFEISSAGIKFFLLCNEKIKKENGNFFLNNISNDLANTLASLGASEMIYGWLPENNQKEEILSPDKITNIENTTYEFFDIKRELLIDSSLEAYGNPNKLIESNFSANDAFLLQYTKDNIGLGIGDLSYNIEANESFFGEYVNIGSYSFHMPSYVNALPDYQITKNSQNEKNSCKINTLYGLRSHNHFRNLAHFYNDNKKETSLTNIIKSAMSYVNSKAICFTIFANISSLYGSKLISSPLQNKKEILSTKNLENNFSIIEGNLYNNNIVAIAGFAICDADTIIQNFLKPYDERINLYTHIHCVVFNKQEFFIVPQRKTDDTLALIMQENIPIDLYHLFKKNEKQETNFYDGIIYFDSLNEFKTGKF